MLCEAGFVRESVELDPDAVLDYLVPIIEPARAEEFTFTRGWLRTQAARIADPRSPAHQLGRQLNLPPAYLLIHRVTLSTIGVLCQLGATVRLREELRDWLPGFLPDGDGDGGGAGEMAEDGEPGAGESDAGALHPSEYGPADGLADGPADGAGEEPADEPFEKAAGR